MKNINTRLQEMTNKLSSKELFESNGLGNEINFHVFDYDPEDEYIVRDYLDNYLLKKTKLNIQKYIWCFYIWLIGDILWCTFDFTQGMYGRSVLDFIQIILAICGIVSWKKDNKTRGGV